VDARTRFAEITGLEPVGEDWDAGVERLLFYRELSAMIRGLGSQWRMRDDRAEEALEIGLRLHSSEAVVSFRYRRPRKAETD
jgi:hypothetical protein